MISLIQPAIRSNRLNDLLITTRAQLRHTRENNRKRAASCWCAAIYLEDKSYGGPEEGGWWYTHGSLILSPDAPFPIWWRAGEKREDDIRAMELWCTGANHERPSISSVLSEGRYTVIINRNDLPTHYPKKRPYYS